MSTLSNVQHQTNHSKNEFAMRVNGTTSFQGQVRKCAQVLIAEGDLSKRTVLELTLQSEGYEVTALETGKEVLEYLQKNTPDLMVLDTNLPQVSGVDICSRIKRVKRLKEIPVIIVCPKKDDRIAESVKMVGANEFFPRPFKNIQLKSKIRDLITRYSYN